jgi:hypothetical protein
VRLPAEGGACSGGRQREARTFITESPMADDPPE